MRNDPETLSPSPGDRGEAQPPAPARWDALGLSPELLELVQTAGFATPTEIQAQTIPLAIKGSDLIASAKTGSGKTAAFSLPIIEKLKGRRGTLALVLAPTREIALQTLETMKKFGEPLGITSIALIGGTDVKADERALALYPHVIVGTPGRICDHLERGNLWLEFVEHLVLDEADRMLDMGFAKELNRIVNELPANRQTLLFSATIPASIEKLGNEILHRPERIAIGSALSVNRNVQHEVLWVQEKSRRREVIRFLERQKGTAIVFTKTKDDCTHLWRSIHAAGIHESTYISSNKSQAHREEALEGFKVGRYRVLVATDVAGRGIHVENVSCVVNFGVPEEPEDYIHRVGRTGRKDQQGMAITFATPAEAKKIRRIEEVLKERLPSKYARGVDAEMVGGSREASPRGEQRGGRSDLSRGGRPAEPARRSEPDRPRRHASERTRDQERDVRPRREAEPRSARPRSDRDEDRDVRPRRPVDEPRRSRNDEPAPRRASHRDDEPAPRRSSHRDDVPAPRRSSHRDDVPAPRRSSHRDDVPAPRRSSHRDDVPAPRRSSHRDDVPAPRRSSHRDDVPAPRRSSHRDDVPAPRRSSHRDDAPAPRRPHRDDEPVRRDRDDRPARIDRHRDEHPERPLRADRHRDEPAPRTDRHREERAPLADRHRDERPARFASDREERPRSASHRDDRAPRTERHRDDRSEPLRDERPARETRHGRSDSHRNDAPRGHRDVRPTRARDDDRGPRDARPASRGEARHRDDEPRRRDAGRERAPRHDDDRDERPVARGRGHRRDEGIPRHDDAVPDRDETPPRERTAVASNDPKRDELLALEAEAWQVANEERHPGVWAASEDSPEKPFVHSAWELARARDAKKPAKPGSSGARGGKAPAKGGGSRGGSPRGGRGRRK